MFVLTGLEKSVGSAFREVVDATMTASLDGRLPFDASLCISQKTRPGQQSSSAHDTILTTRPKVRAPSDTCAEASTHMFASHRQLV